MALDTGTHTALVGPNGADSVDLTSGSAKTPFCFCLDGCFARSSMSRASGLDAIKRNDRLELPHSR